MQYCYYIEYKIKYQWTKNGYNYSNKKEEQSIISTYNITRHIIDTNKGHDYNLLKYSYE